MTQIYETVMEKKKPKMEKAEVDELLGDLNPRYFEETYSPEEAKNKALASRISPYSNLGVF
ncbi:MAG: hypothetical protein ACFFG0_21195 [Candidatus Thorarchaeota archaeon]